MSAAEHGTANNCKYQISSFCSAVDSFSILTRCFPVQLSALGPQERHNVQMPVSSCEVQRSELSFILGCYVCSCLNQVLSLHRTGVYIV